MFLQRKYTNGVYFEPNQKFANVRSEKAERNRKEKSQKGSAVSTEKEVEESDPLLEGIPSAQKTIVASHKTKRKERIKRVENKISFNVIITKKAKDKSLNKIRGLETKKQVAWFLVAMAVAMFLIAYATVPAANLAFFIGLSILFLLAAIVVGIKSRGT